MNIGIDIDNVVNNFDEGFIAACKEYDKKLRNAGMVNKNADNMLEVFDWTFEERMDFLAERCEELAKKLDIKWDCKKYIDKLLEEGHNVYLITNRAEPCFTKPQESTIEWLEEHDVNYTELIFSESPDKTKECRENKIDFMFDDRLDQCKLMLKQGINCVVMLTEYNKYHLKHIPQVANWKGIYYFIKQKERKEIRANNQKNKNTKSKQQKIYEALQRSKEGSDKFILDYEGEI